MATVLDVAAVMHSSLSVSGMNGQLDVHLDGPRSTSWTGQPAGYDNEAVVTAKSLDPAS